MFSWKFTVQWSGRGTYSICFCRGMEGLERKQKQKGWEELFSRNNGYWKYEKCIFYLSLYIWELKNLGSGMKTKGIYWKKTVKLSYWKYEWGDHKAEWNVLFLDVKEKIIFNKLPLEGFRNPPVSLSALCKEQPLQLSCLDSTKLIPTQDWDRAQGWTSS